MGDIEVTPFRCATCNFALWHSIASLSVSTLGLYDDARFPGRCILALNTHHEEFDRLPEQLSSLFVADAQRVGRALRVALGDRRINFAILGNQIPHLHWHIIPRSDDEPLSQHSPWNHPGPKTQLLPSELELLKRSIFEALSVTG